VRTLPTAVPREGVGRGGQRRAEPCSTLQDRPQRGIITGANLIVAHAVQRRAHCMGVEKAAKKLITAARFRRALLNMVEMAFRAYDPCLGCATHALPGRTCHNSSSADPGGSPLAV